MGNNLECTRFESSSPVPRTFVDSQVPFQGLNKRIESGNRGRILLYLGQNGGRVGGKKSRV